MGAPIDVAVLAGSFAGHVDGVRWTLGAPDNASLFPGHFLKATFPKMGGMLVRVGTEQGPAALGFLFPRGLKDGQREYTLRLHRVGQAQEPEARDIEAAVGRRIGANVTVYEPGATALTYAPEAPPEDGLRICEPSEADAEAIRRLQEQIWRPESADALYPVDLHSRQFRPGTSLIAKLDGAPVGFLFGFFKFGGEKLPAALEARHPAGFRLESQLMGVVPGSRGARISLGLKLRQAEQARVAGVHVVNWTFDPLQYVNASLNFRRLGAVAFDFYPRYYDFSNELNRAPASRLNVTWLVNAAAARRASAEVEPARVDVGALPGIVRLNDGPARVASAGDAVRIAVEIPADWSALQRDPAQLDAVMQWRATTDAILAEHLGPEEGRYVLTGADRDAEGRCYLLGERVDAALLARIGETV